MANIFCKACHNLQKKCFNTSITRKKAQNILSLQPIFKLIYTHFHFKAHTKCQANPLGIKYKNLLTPACVHQCELFCWENIFLANSKPFSSHRSQREPSCVPVEPLNNNWFKYLNTKFPPWMNVCFCVCVIPNTGLDF